MYITITNIVGKKRIDLAYLIWGKEVAVISMFSNNIRYEFMKPRTLELEELSNKRMTAGTYTR